MSQVRFFPTFPAVGALLLMVMLVMSCGDKDVFSPSDGIAPSTPGTPTATAVSHTQINLTWSASTDNGNITNGGVQGYRVFRNGSYLRFVKTASMSDEGLAASTLYKYRVQAQDGSGQLSALTAETDQAGATTQATPALATDVTVPAKATAVVALETAAGSIKVTWTTATDDRGIAIYYIKRDGTLIDSTTALTITDAAAGTSNRT